MRAAVLGSDGILNLVEDLIVPKLLHGQVRVAMKMAGVCRSQLMEVRGLRGDDPYLPHLLGHEGVGKVEDIGPGVTKVKPGDRVILSWIAGLGIQSENPTFVSAAGERINAGSVTTFSEVTVVSENRVYRCPDSLDDATAAIMGCALLTGGGIILNQCAEAQPRTVLISGLGGIGLVALVFALHLGYEVYGLEPDPEKRRIAHEAGARFVADPNNSECLRELEGLTSPGIDFAVDCSGSVNGIELAYSLVRYGGGKLVVASHPPQGKTIRLDSHDLIRGREIEGSWGGQSNPDVDIPRIAEFIETHKIDFSLLNSKTYHLSEVNQALDDLGYGTVARPVILFP